MMVEYMSLTYWRLLLPPAELVVRAKELARDTADGPAPPLLGAAPAPSSPLFCLPLVSVSDLRRCRNASDWRRRRRRATSSSSFTVPGEFIGPRLRLPLTGVDGASSRWSLSSPPSPPGASKKLSSKPAGSASPSLAMPAV